MDIYELEYAAKVIFAMCRQHPKICPHDYKWEWSQTKENIEEKHYKCRLCGNEIIKNKEL